MVDSISTSLISNRLFPFPLFIQGHRGTLCPFTCFPHPWTLLFLSLYGSHTSRSTLPTAILPHTASCWWLFQGTGAIHCYIPQTTTHTCTKTHTRILVNSEWFVFHFLTPIAHDRNRSETLHPKSIVGTRWLSGRKGRFPLWLDRKPKKPIDSFALTLARVMDIWRVALTHQGFKIIEDVSGPRGHFHDLRHESCDCWPALWEELCLWMAWEQRLGDWRALLHAER